MRNRRVQLAAALGMALLVTAGCGGKEQAKESGAGASPGQAQAAAAPTPVRVTEATLSTVTRTVPVTGSIQALDTIDLSPKIAARVVSVSGREGATVSRGEVLVQQDTSDLERQVAQRRADVAAAQSRVSQALTNLRLQDTTNRTSIANAQAQLRGAQAQLALAKRPQRSQEVAVAENNVAQAQANYDKARKDRERYDSLVKEGAAPQMTLDQYVTQEKVAQAALNSAKEQLAIAREGGRSESILSSQEQVRQAEANLRQARANTQQLDVRRDEVEAARAQLAQAQAALGVAQQAVADAAIRSPIDGVIASRNTEPGQQAAPGGPAVMQVVALSNVFFEAKVPGTDIAAVQTGQTVQVAIDAYPGRSFTGKIVRVYPTGNATSRTFNVRVEIPNSGATLRPGLFARGDVVAERRQNVVTVPQNALLREAVSASGEASSAARLFTVENGVAREKKVNLGLTTPDGGKIEVTGIEPGSQVVVVGQRGIKDGDKVTPETEQGAATSQPAATEAASLTTTQKQQQLAQR